MFLHHINRAFPLSHAHLSLICMSNVFWVPMRILLIALCAFALCSCASKADASRQGSSAGRRELPWNTPQSWEGMGPLGGYAEMMSSR